jgi:hypothetical protein
LNFIFEFEELELRSVSCVKREEDLQDYEKVRSKSLR